MIPASVSDYLERHQAQYSLLSHPTAYTAQEEAAAARVPGHEWAKTVVCFADDRPILAVLPAPFAVDLSRLQQTAHATSIRLAKESEFAPLYQDCEPGAMPPLGPSYGQPVFVDKQLTTDPEVSFSAGSHHDAVRMTYGEFERLVKPTVGEFASGPSVSSATTTRTRTRRGNHTPAPSRESSVVRRGGVAESEAETEDVTRDTYGFPPSAPTPPTSAERIANAEHEAERAGMPGLEIPESPTELEERARRPEPSPKPERD